MAHGRALHGRPPAPRRTGGGARLPHAPAPPGRSPATPWRSPAFSLAEVLIVTSIIIILAVMLAAVGGYAIAEGHQVQCRHNLHGLSVALRFYADAHEGALPVSDRLEGPHLSLVTSMTKYVDDPQIYYCPADSGADFSYSKANVEAGIIGYFYYACRQAPAAAGIHPCLQEAELWQDGKRELTLTMDGGLWLMSDRWFAGKPTTHRFAEQAVNYLTVGGYVQTLSEKPEDLFK
jgi:type II secretory pathway pseudopilin PulG